MIRLTNKGFALDKLMILAISVSVVATSAWNAQLRGTDSLREPSAEGEFGGKIKIALEEIKYHIRLAGYKPEGDAEPLVIEKGQKSDIIKIRHNGACYEYLVDSNDDLIRRVESTEKVIAGNINSIKTVRVGQNTVVVSISSAWQRRGNRDEIEVMSRSYSAIVEMRNL